MGFLTKKRKHNSDIMDTDAEDAAVMAHVNQAIKDIWPQPKSPFPPVVQMYIGKLHHSVTSDDILQLALLSGVPTVLVNHPETGNYAFITILERDREKAMSMNGTVMKGKQIVVSEARKQKLTPPISRMSNNRRIHICQFSFSHEGRCEHDATLDGPNPNCPFGKHSMGLLAPAAKPKESTLEVCQEQIYGEDWDRSTAKRRKKAADSKGITEKCWEPSDTLPAGEYIMRQNIEP